MASAAPPPKTLVVCFDGTSNQFDATNTNVVRFFSLLDKDRRTEQLCYYQPGIGTYYQPGVISPMFEWAAKMLDEACAWYLYEHVTDGYRFIMQNYRDGDRICIFGFSRGAYSARALAGLLHKIGLLPKDNSEQLPFAYKLYKRTDKAGMALADGFKRTFCRTVLVEFVGVWDTVESVGVIAGPSLPFTQSNMLIKTFRHALSLDEHRIKYMPNLYHRPSPSSQAAANDPEHASALEPSPAAGTPSTSAAPPPPPPRHGRAKDGAVNGSKGTPAKKTNGWKWPLCANTAGDDGVPGGTDVLEVWFAGCHSDVGGGSTPDDTRRSLADISLRWMVREVVMSGAGVIFAPGALDTLFEGAPAGLLPLSPPAPAAADAPATLGNSIPAGEAMKEDMCQPAHDQLGWHGKWAWWILELTPLIVSWQDANGVWHKRWRINMGRGRRIPDISPIFHETVRMRMNDAKLKYKPRASWKHGTERYQW